MHIKVMFASETTKDDSAAETIDKDSRRYGELLDRDKYIAGKKESGQLESFGWFDVSRKVRLQTAHTCA